MKEPASFDLNRNLFTDTFKEIEGREDITLADLETLFSALQHCTLCVNRCGLDRTLGAIGPCGAGLLPKVARWLPHKGEEPPISGLAGSGTIFFSGCSLKCVFCQNYTISQEHEGREISILRLAEIMIRLEQAGCHNINFVSPTHYTPQIALALQVAGAKGLKLPVVYNTHGVDTAEALEWMNGKVDIYLPDMKYSDDRRAEQCSGVKGYSTANRHALKMMFSQVGHLQEDGQTGLAHRGMLVRILLLPEGQEGAKASLIYLKKQFSTRLRISLMAQYGPQYLAAQSPSLNRRLKLEDYEEIVAFADALGFNHLWLQEPGSADVGVPDFSAEIPFKFD